MEDLLADAPVFREYNVPMSMHKDNRHRLVERLQQNSALAKSFALLQGGQTLEQYDTDHEVLFRQESNFQYLFGIPETDSLGGIDVATGKSYFFAPKRDPSWAVWCGEMYDASWSKD